MMPIGLKFKSLKENPFTNKVSGELMVVHACLGCGKISANRIAGDDNSYQLLKLLDSSNKYVNKFASQLAKKVLD